jgi:hypothetical protein
MTHEVLGRCIVDRVLETELMDGSRDKGSGSRTGCNSSPVASLLFSFIILAIVD